MKYTNIKKVLQNQINKGVKALWTFNEPQKEFTMIYKNYSNELQIYTAKQLLDHLSIIEKESS